MKETFKWTVLIKNDSIIVEEKVSDFIKSSNNYEESDYFVHDLLLDFHFVSNMRKIQKNNPNNKSLIESLNIINGYIGLFFDCIWEAIEILEDINVEFDIKCSQICRCLRYVLLKEENGKIKQNNISKDDIDKHVPDSNIDKFKEFLFPIIEETQKILFDDLNNVKEYFEKQVSEKYKHLYKKYVKGSSCFSITEVFDNNNLVETIFTLSGVQGKPELSTELRSIASNCSNSHCICFDSQDIDNVQYLDVKRNQIKYCKAKKLTNYNNRYNRMFSCCERKTFAYMHYVKNYQNGCKFQMYVKYPPCELCAPFVNYYITKWSGSVVYYSKNDKICSTLSEDQRRTWEEFAMGLSFPNPIVIK